MKSVHAVLGSLKQNVGMIRSKECPQASAGMEIAKTFFRALFSICSGASGIKKG